MSLLDLPNGWVGLEASSALPLREKWLSVKDDRLPSELTAVGDEEAHAYGQDHIEWTRDRGRDEWQTPTITLLKGTGDCEDFALLYRALLLNGGADDSSLWLVILYDLIARCDHAVLWTPTHYLDCRARIPLAHSNFCDYRPICAFSANEACLFGRRR